MFRGFKELISSFRDDITFNVITNGLLLDEDITDYLLDQSGRVLSCSIDDIEINPRTLLMKCGKNSFKFNLF